MEFIRILWLPTSYCNKFDKNLSNAFNLGIVFSFLKISLLSQVFSTVIAAYQRDRAKYVDFFFFYN